MTTDTDYTIVDVLALVADEGSVVYFGARDIVTGDRIVFAADHRPAQALADALYNTEEIVTVAVETWQIIARRPAESKEAT